jgi:hypothetical protein
MTCDYWLEEIQNSDGSTTWQLQYSQTIDLVFPASGNPRLFIWPHVDVNTLVKQ